MERDIFLSTGFVPQKLRALMQCEHEIEGRELSYLLQLVRIEGSKVKGVNQPITVRKIIESRVLMIGKGSLFHIPQAPAVVKEEPLTTSTFESLGFNDSQRIKLDLGKVQDKVTDR